MVSIAFTDLVRAAAAAGFDAALVGAAVYRHAVKDGLSMTHMRRILDDSGIWVSEVEGVGNWLTTPDDKPEQRAQKVSDEELLDLALALGPRDPAGDPLRLARVGDGSGGVIRRPGR